MPFSVAKAVIMLDGKYGYIDKQGKTIIPPHFDNAWSYKNGLARVENAGKVGYVDDTGHVVIAPQFKWGQSFQEGLAAVTLDYWDYGYINQYGELVIPAQYDDARPFSDGLAPVKHQGKWGYVSLD